MERIPDAPVQIVPPGFLGLLQVKNAGQSPDKLLNTVQPTSDMLGFWLRGRQRAVKCGTLIAPVTAVQQILTLRDSNAATPLLTPSGEWWYCAYFGLQLISGVGDTTTNPALVARYGNTAMDADVPLAVLTASLAASGAITIAARDFWIPPQTHLCLGLGATVITNAIAISGGLVYTPLPV